MRHVWHSHFQWISIFNWTKYQVAHLIKYNWKSLGQNDCRQGEEMREKRHANEQRRGSSKGEQGTGLTYMRWKGLQAGETLVWVQSFPFGNIGLQAWAGLIHWHRPTGPPRLPAFRGWGAGRVRVVCTARGLIGICWGLPPERGVLALQRLQLERDGQQYTKRSKASFGPCY